MVHPPKLAAGISEHQGMSGDILCDNRSCIDEKTLAQGRVAYDCGVGSDGRALTNEGCFNLISSADLNSRIGHVGEHHARAAEYSVLKDYSFEDRDIVLNLAPVLRSARWVRLPQFVPRKYLLKIEKVTEVPTHEPCCIACARRTLNSPMGLFNLRSKRAFDRPERMRQTRRKPPKFGTGARKRHLSRFH